MFCNIRVVRSCIVRMNLALAQVQRIVHDIIFLLSATKKRSNNN